MLQFVNGEFTLIINSNNYFVSFALYRACFKHVRSLLSNQNSLRRKIRWRLLASVFPTIQQIAVSNNTTYYERCLLFICRVCSLMTYLVGCAANCTDWLYGVSSCRHEDSSMLFVRYEINWSRLGLGTRCVRSVDNAEYSRVYRHKRAAS